MDIVKSGRATSERIVAGREITPRLIRIWEKVLEAHSIDLDSNFFELGGDSIQALYLLSEIESTFNLKLPHDAIVEAPTVKALSQVINHRLRHVGESPLVTIQSGGSRPPFFCIHALPGNVFAYRVLAKHLGADQPFYGLQSQGLDGKMPPLHSVEEMAARYLPEIQSVQAHGPYYLGGYCGGGTIALEIARQLVARGENVALLALIDTSDWSKLRPMNIRTRIVWEIETIIFHAANLAALRPHEILPFTRTKWELFRSSMKGRMRRTVCAVLAPFWPVARARHKRYKAVQNVRRLNFEALDKYLPKPYLGTITDFRPKRQYTRLDKPELNWEKIAVGGLRSVVLSVCPKNDMLIEPFVKQLANELRIAMDRAIKQDDLSKTSPVALMG